MKENLIDTMQKLFLCLSDATRLRILEMLCSGERSVSEFVDALNEPQPKVSRHLAIMRDDGIVTTRREGKHIYYKLDMNIGNELWPVMAVTMEVLGGRPPAARGPNEVNISEATDIRRSHDAESEAGGMGDELPVFLL